MDKTARNPRTPSRRSPRASDNGLDLVAIQVNFDRRLLDRINSHARALGLNRTAFIVNAVGEKLLSLERSEA